MKQTITRREAGTYSQILSAALSADIGRDANYAVQKNVRRLSPINAKTAEEEKAIVDEFAVKDEEGVVQFKPAPEPTHPLPEKKGEKAPEPRQIIDFGENQQSADDAWVKLMAEEVEVDLHMVPLSAFSPDCGLTGGDYFNLDFMIE